MFNSMVRFTTIFTVYIRFTANLSSVTFHSTFGAGGRFAWWLAGIYRVFRNLQRR
jgi:hypothetical protein